MERAPEATRRRRNPAPAVIPAQAGIQWVTQAIPQSGDDTKSGHWIRLARVDRNRPSLGPSARLPGFLFMPGAGAA